MAIRLHKTHSNLDTVRKYLKGEKLDIKISNYISDSERYRSDGEQWTSNGIEYKRENGRTIRITKTQGDIIRAAIDVALDCKMCGARWNLSGKFDRSFMLRTGLCSDCLIDHETKLRILGIYDSYEKYKLASYELGTLKNDRDKLIEIVAYFKNNSGDIVKQAETEYDENIVWRNTNKDTILRDAIVDLKKVKTLIQRGTRITKDYKKQYESDIAKHKMPNILKSKRNTNER